jgi:hypothetical protein
MYLNYIRLYLCKYLYFQPIKRHTIDKSNNKQIYVKNIEFLNVFLDGDTNL